jgi:hypothetical protein
MNTSRLPPRVLLVLLVVVCVATVAAVVAGVVAGREAVEVAPGSTPVSDVGPASVAPADGRGERRTRMAARVLRGWDTRRARAWARGDVAGLRALYAPGARAGRRDAAMLRAWQRRGLRVHGMRMQVLDLRVCSRGPGRLVLAVTDRLARAVAVGGGRAVRLPRDAASARTLVLDQQRGVWRVAAVRDRGQPAR